MPTADRIKQVRQELEMTQTQFARALGISVWTLRGWEQEKGEPPAFLELALRYLLSLSAKELTGLTKRKSK